MPDLSFMYSLVSPGLVAGAGAGAAAWMLGYAISSIYNLIRRS